MKVDPVDNLKLAEIEIAVERAWAQKQTTGQTKILTDIQSLIERIKKDDEKIRQLEAMKGINWREAH